MCRERAARHQVARDWRQKALGGGIVAILPKVVLFVVRCRGATPLD